MSCKQVRRMLSYRREWTRGEAARAEEHLAACPSCQLVARQYELMDRRFDRLPVPIAMVVAPPVIPAALSRRSAPAPRPAAASPRPAGRGVLVLIALALVVVAATVLSVSPPQLGPAREPTSAHVPVVGITDARSTGEAPGAAWLRVPGEPEHFSFPPASSDRRITVLLLGIDRRGGSGWGYRTDTIVVVSADPETGAAAMLSIPRDLQVPIPRVGDNRINVANVYGYTHGYPGGGPALAIDAIEASFGIDIDAYVVVDFDGFVEAIDALGGIEVDVPQALDDPFYPDPRPDDPHAHTTVHFDAGAQQMDGERALQYARSRMSTSDADRAERQQLILLAALEKARSSRVFRTLPDLVFRLAGSVHTDLTLAELVNLAALAAQIDPSDVERQVLREPLVTPHRRENGAAVLLPQWDLIDPVIEELFGPVPALHAVDHTVAPGDNVWSIAQRYWLQPETIVWANPEIQSAPDLLVVGQKLIIPPVDGVWHTVVEGDTVSSLAAEFETTAAKIVGFEGNDLEEPYILRMGQQIMIPDGKKESVVAGHRYPMPELGAAPAGAPTGSGRFSWPSTGVLSQAFWSGHSGIDISGRTGVPIRAADAGYVSLAGRDTWGYGLQVVVDHGNGYVTRYAHLDTMLVRAGDSVTKGQQIGTMGSTGRATSVHLHFEVMENGVPRNPLGYLP
ncbi:MAG TPA: LCP family protein [Anaerolineae bacterium]|nr:LCP family protein [Anaerolineae bacterium]